MDILVLLVMLALITYTAKEFLFGAAEKYTYTSYTTYTYDDEEDVTPEEWQSLPLFRDRATRSRFERVARGK